MESPKLEAMDEDSSKKLMKKKKSLSIVNKLKLSQCEPWSFELYHIEETKGKTYEPLYRKYNQLQKNNAVLRFIYLSILFDLWVALTISVEPDFQLNNTKNLIRIIGWCVKLVLTIIVLIAYLIMKEKRLLSHIMWWATWCQVCVTAMERHEDSWNEGLGWAMALTYMHFTTMPLVFVKLLAYGTVSTLIFIASQMINKQEGWDNDFWLQQLLNALLLCVSAVLGVVSYLLMDKQQRFAFLEARRNLEVKLLIEEQSKEQERLLLSVLPEHVAEQMRKDLGAIDRQFKKIYMSRHENVSILYADIVGFTAISSTYSAQDLVAILNELFARFDKLAEKYQQLRIKILGDCYYCISGAPVERPDHAILCVHMGLSMVKAIKYVQQITSSPVDMRVGIHTGAVLAGVLGQRQWQFDVYSKDVELANKMESSGMPGRVHISEMTLGFLGDHFEVEPAHGERREEALRQANIKTYFIKKVLKPFIGCHPVGNNCGDSGNHFINSLEHKQNGTSIGRENNWDEDGAETPSELKDDDEESVKSPLEDSPDEEVAIIARLEDEILSRDDKKELKGKTNLCLQFTESEMEQQYIQRDEACHMVFAVQLLVVPGVALLDYVYSPRSVARLAFICGLFLISFAATTNYYIYYKRNKNKNCKINCRIKQLATIGNVILMTIATTTELSCCLNYLKEEVSWTIDMAYHFTCTHTSYFWHASVLVLVGTLFVSPVSVSALTILLLLASLSHGIPYLVSPSYTLHLLRHEMTNITSSDAKILPINTFPLRHLLMLLMIAIAFAIYIRYTESCSRARFVRATRLSEARKHAADMRRRNVRLVYNLLPPHVALHFMGSQRRRHHRDLYSQSLQEVGVLFASMPNFTEFYSEETVNNQGLECLRFLNEVISDFDALLDKPQFKDIIKIKTIGSTYMAASGLNPSSDVKPGDPVTIRWQHLDCLVQFALELKEALQGINEQSFNHFVLKMGVNHGPITAGVIGAKKPHYDIWGNTVNVASRMESTGKAGSIQVTAETCDILKQFGYYFEQRGLVAVKGKGQLMTYYLLGKDTNLASQQTPREIAVTDSLEHATPKIKINEESEPREDSPFLGSKNVTDDSSSK